MLSKVFLFEAAFTTAITALCAILWETEAMPIPVTAFIPLSVFPLTGIISREELSIALGNPILLLLLQGFILSIATLIDQSVPHACKTTFNSMNHLNTLLLNAFGRNKIHTED